MLRRTSVLMFLGFLLIWAAATVQAQAPTGVISGTVTDQTGAVMPNVSVTVTEKTTGTARTLTTNNSGLYSAPALLAGDYEVRAESAGFRTMVRQATVTAGNTITVDMSMALGQASDVVNVEATAAAINYESHTVAGTIARNTIQELPINGRSFLNLATLEPGVTVTTGVPAQFNSLINVQVLGAVTSYVRMTIDGGIINDEWEGNGSTSLNVSQEVVQEFQMSSVNFDASSGIGAGGQVNIVTRSGSNTFHGSGYFFFRDHNMAAYPGLRRPDNVTAFNPNCKDPSSAGCKAAQSPFFVRRNPGVWVGGPIKKDKLFFFTNYEYQNQVQAYALQQDLPSLAGLSTVSLSPYVAKYFTTRFDYILSPKHTLFARYSHDGNLGFGPYGGAQPLQSSWSSNNNWSDQSVIGVTSLLTPNLVNDVRGFYHWWRSLVEIASASQCPAPCVGQGLMSLVSNAGTGMVGSSTFYAGASDNSPQPRQERSYEIVDNLSWQKGAHRMKFGFDYERMVTNNDWEFCSLGCAAVYSPETTLAQANPGLLAQYLPNLPRTISTTADLLALPVFNTGAAIYSGIDVGHGNFPGPYQRGTYNHNDRPRFYVGDVWKVTPNLTLNAALDYEFETGLWYSLPYPSLLSPIVGNNLSAPPNHYKEFAPQFGFAYAVGKDKKTVIRGGAGLFWDSEPLWHHFRAGASLGPLGNGRTTLAATSLTNIFPNIVNLSNGQPLPIGSSIPLNTLTNMTLGQFIQIYNAQLPALQQQFAPTPPTSGPFSVAGLDVAKTSVEIHAPNFAIQRSYQNSLGVQRDLGRDMILQVDWARRQFENVDLGELDLNRFSRPLSQGGPVIPACAKIPDFNPADKCSNGNMTFWVPQGRTIYEAMLLKLSKRMSNRFQGTVAYAFQNQNAVNAPTLDLNNYFATYGPGLARHNLHVNGIVELPWGFELSINQAIISRTPVDPVLISPIGSAANTFGSSVLLPISLAVPGTTFNSFGLTSGKSDLQNLVDKYNSTYGQHVALPSHYQFGDPFYDTDFRLTKNFTYRERYTLKVAGEVFNAFNIANLSGYGFTVGTTTFGQPTARVIQTFGSGGPRAFQVLARISF
ncbi:MAG TPA: carboxypeptidase-like regulatory domain-containing protein [Bryobacteraceae bacterium]|nr:carboxypeptidase-like regulatory domain-containing protein [Bryobacteraceae bacterium]